MGGTRRLNWKVECQPPKVKGNERQSVCYGDSNVWHVRTAYAFAYECTTFIDMFIYVCLAFYGMLRIFVFIVPVSLLIHVCVYSACCVCVSVIVYRVSL